MDGQTTAGIISPSPETYAGFEVFGGSRGGAEWQRAPWGPLSSLSFPPGPQVSFTTGSVGPG